MITTQIDKLVKARYDDLIFALVRNMSVSKQQEMLIAIASYYDEQYDDLIFALVKNMSVSKQQEVLISIASYYDEQFYKQILASIATIESYEKHLRALVEDITYNVDMGGEDL